MKNLMKRLVAATIAVMLIMSLAACTGAADVDSDAADSSSQSNVTATDAAQTDVPEWKQFLIDFEAWVDRFIELTAQCEANPEDAELLTEYLAVAGEAESWATRSEEMANEIEDADDLLEYSQELLRISDKLTEAVS